jgi:DNA polymerase
MDRRQLAEHLRFYQELGVAGISRDAAWRARAPGVSNQAHPDEPVPPDDGSAGDTHHRDAGPEVGPRGDTDAGADVSLAPSTESSGAPLHFARSRPEALAAIRDEIGDCTRCKLHGLGRTQIVFGVGNPSADLMFVGEAPGADEDIQGEPFVGRAGQLLTKMIEAMGFQRSDVYIANVLKCRPPGNRNPEPDEIERCEPFLFQQIASIQPKVIIALGAFAARTLLETQDPISRLRGRVYAFRGAQLIPTFHPSFLLRSPGYKREAWEDLKKALALLDRQPPPSAASGSSRTD